MTGTGWRFPLSRSSIVRLSVGAVLGVGWLAIGFLVTRISPELILISMAALPVVILVFNQPEWAVLAILVTAAFVRFSIGTGTQSRIVASLLATAAFTGLWLVRMLVLDRRLHLKRASTNLPLLALVLVACVSLFWSNAFRDPLVYVSSTWPLVQLGGLAVTVLLPGAFFLTANSISEVRWLKILWGLFLSVGVLALVSYFLRVRLSFLNTGGLFSLWFVVTTYAQALFNKKLPLWLRLVLLGLVGAWVYVYFVRWISWLTGWLPSLAGLSVVSLLKSRRLFLVVVLLIALYVGLNWSYYGGSVFAAEREESGVTRLAAWQQNWRVTGKHLLFGTGPAGYAAYYMSYFPTEAMATHNNYLDILSQFGLAGLLLCLWFLATLGWTGYRLSRRLKGRADFSEGLANGALAGWAGSVLAMALGDWMFPFVYTQTIAGFDYAVYSWIFLASIVILDNIYAAGGGDG